MDLWKTWFECVNQLKGACSRYRTFLWMVAFLMAITIRCGDLSGATTVVRVLGLSPYYYDRILDFLHSPALNINKLSTLWVKLVIRLFSSSLVKVNNSYVLVGDGIKVSKEGKKMPAVKALHQSSASNSKSEYIMGHSCQAVSILTKAETGVFAVPLISRIHEGLVFSNRCTKTLYDKILKMISGLECDFSYYFIADAYYAVSKMVGGLLADGNHLITRAKKNAVAYRIATPAPGKPKRGRPLKYGEKIKLKSLFDDEQLFTSAQSPVYGERSNLKFYSVKLLWRPAAIVVQFVAVIHPLRGKILLMSTDLDLAPIEIIRLYGLRFKIEVSFKQSLYTIGAYAYHFWMKTMVPIKHHSGDQYLHRKSQKYRDATIRKLNAYHRHIQLGLIAQGLLQYLSCTMANTVWKQFGSWIRTIRPGIVPSEQVTAMAFKNSLHEFLADNSKEAIFKKFLLERIDVSRAEGMRMVV